MDSYKFMDGVYVYFVTLSIKDWLPIFVSHEPKQIVVDSLRFCIVEKYLRIHAYVIMHDHMHMIIFDAKFNNSRLQKSLTSFRKFTGNNLANYIDKNYADSLSGAIRRKAMNDRVRQVWQTGWHAEGIANEWFLEQKAQYIHDNPVRKGYVNSPEYWEYSSARFWLIGEEGPLPVVLFVHGNE